jgi:hypothetical protein
VAATRGKLLLAAGIAVGVLLCGGLGSTVFLIVRQHTACRTAARDLRSYLVPRPPSARAHAGGPIGNGLLNLDQASQISISEPADESKLLSTNGFHCGAAALWTTAGGTDVVIGLFHFDSTNGAIVYFAQETAQVQRIAPPADVHLLEDVPAGLTVVVTAPVDGYYLMTSYAERGDVTIVVMIRRAAAPAPVSMINDLLSEQYERL